MYQVGTCKKTSFTAAPALPPTGAAPAPQPAGMRPALLAVGACLALFALLATALPLAFPLAQPATALANTSMAAAQNVWGHDYVRWADTPKSACT